VAPPVTLSAQDIAGNPDVVSGRVKVVPEMAPTICLVASGATLPLTKRLS